MDDFFCPVPDCKKQFSPDTAPPKTLQCLHTVCLNCLKEEFTNGGQAFVVCPVPACRTRHVLKDAEKGLERGIKTDYFIERASSRFKALTSPDSSPTCNECSDCDQAQNCCETCGALLCEDCSNHHRRARDYRDHRLKSIKEILDERETKKGKDDAILPFTTKQKWNCEGRHGRGQPPRSIQYYCWQCKKMACMDCVVVDHYGHSLQISNVAGEKIHVETDLDALRQIHGNYAKAIDDTDEQIEKLERAYRLATKAVETTSKNLEGNLLAERETLLMKVKHIHDQRMREIGEKMKEFADSERDVSHSIEYAKSAAELCLPEDFLEQEKALLERLSHLCQEFENHPLVPSQRDVFVRSPCTDVDLNGAVGQVYTNPDFDSLKRGFELASFRQGTKTKFSLTCLDTFGTPLPATDFELEIAGLTEDAEKFPMMKNKDGTFTGALLPQGFGEHPIHLEARYPDRVVPLAPFTINVSPNLLEEAVLEKKAKCEEIRGMIHLAGIALSEQYIAVTDIESHRVFILSLDGQCVNVVGGEAEGAGEGEFKSPWGVDWWGENLVVADTGNHRVQVLPIQGKMFKQFGRYGGLPGEFYEPTDVAVSVSENATTITVADSVNFRIQVFKMDHVEADPQLLLIHPCKNQPLLLSTGRSGCIYLTENVVHQFKILSPVEAAEPKIADLSVDQKPKANLQEHRAYTNHFGNEQDLSPIVGLTYDPCTQYVLLTELGCPNISVFDKNGLYVGRVRVTQEESQLESISALNSRVVAIAKKGTTYSVIVLTLL